MRTLGIFLPSVFWACGVCGLVSNVNLEDTGRHYHFQVSLLPLPVFSLLIHYLGHVWSAFCACPLCLSRLESFYSIFQLGHAQLADQSIRGSLFLSSFFLISVYVFVCYLGSYVSSCMAHLFLSHTITVPAIACGMHHSVLDSGLLIKTHF